MPNTSTQEPLTLADLADGLYRGEQSSAGSVDQPVIASPRPAASAARSAQRRTRPPRRARRPRRRTRATLLYVTLVVGVGLGIYSIVHDPITTPPLSDVLDQTVENAATTNLTLADTPSVGETTPKPTPRKAVPSRSQRATVSTATPGKAAATTRSQPPRASRPSGSPAPTQSRPTPKPAAAKPTPAAVEPAAPTSNVDSCDPVNETC